MNIKQCIVKAHLFLGLVSGLGVLIIALTGALYTFNREIEFLTQGFRKVKAEQRTMILPSEAIEKAKAANPGFTVHGVVYQKPTDALEVVFYQPEPFFYGAAWLNPYSGEVLKVSNFQHTFFGFILRGHTTLWLPFDIGLPVVTFVCIIFLIMLITGIILWWPRKKRSSKSFSFTLRNKASVRRLEMHKVVGFYVSFLALLIVLTGLSWLLEGFDRVVYKAMGGEKEIVYSPPLSNSSNAGKALFSGEAVDVLFQQVRNQNPDMQFIEIHAVEDDSSSILVELNRNPAVYRTMDFLYFDQYTLERIPTNNFYGTYDDANTADKIKRSYYDIHTGSILGLPGKFLAFFASLFAASLPVTGFLLWWNRRKEQKAFFNKMEL